MVDMKVTNSKLRNSAENMVTDITACDPTKAREILVDTNYNIKLSILMLNNYSKEEALKLLHQSSGNLHNIL